MRVNTGLSKAQELGFASSFVPRIKVAEHSFRAVSSVV